MCILNFNQVKFTKLSLYGFLVFFFGGVVKKSPPIPYPGHKNNFLFSSRSFRVLPFTFKSLISNSSCRFGWRRGSIFIFLHANSNCFCTIIHVFPRPSIFPGSFVAVVSQVSLCTGLSLDCLFCSMGHFSVSVSIYVVFIIAVVWLVLTGWADPPGSSLGGPWLFLALCFIF